MEVHTVLHESSQPYQHNFRYVHTYKYYATYVLTSRKHKHIVNIFLYECGGHLWSYALVFVVDDDHSTGFVSLTRVKNTTEEHQFNLRDHHSVCTEWGTRRPVLHVSMYIQSNQLNMYVRIVKDIQVCTSHQMCVLTISTG